MYHKNNKTYIDVDYVDYLTGDKGRKVSKQQGHEDDCIVAGFYISNINDKIRTFQLSDDVQIELFYSPDPKDHELKIYKNLGLDQLQEHIKDNPLLIITLKDELVKSISEQYLP